MEELNNVKLEWNQILMSQKKLLAEKYKDVNAEEVYAPLIDMLNNNRIPSRVFLSGGKVSTYGYIMPPLGVDDRILCSMGFSEYGKDKVDTGKEMIKWFESIAIQSSKLVILDGIFNGEQFFNEIEKLEFRRVHRVKLVCSVDTIIENLKEKESEFTKLKREFIELQQEEVDQEDLAEVQLDSYGDSPDQFLLVYKNGKNITPQVIDSGYYGKILKAPSKVIHNGKIIGSCVISDGAFEFFRINTPLLVDIFVSKEFQNMGYGSHLMVMLAKKLKNLGHRELQLWVNDQSKAIELYQKMGFVEEGEDDLMFFKDFREVSRKD
ncbi:MAG: GNAT family N-acetyltransferase [Cuniculiplasma sp.]